MLCTYSIMNARFSAPPMQVTAPSCNLHAFPPLGKGFILPAPVFPTDQFITSLLPTPMSRELRFMPVQAVVYDKEGRFQGKHDFGNLPRNHQKALVLNDLVQFGQEYGHVELIYD